MTWIRGDSMKKGIIIVLIGLLLTGCNQRIVCSATYNKAVIEGYGEIEISAWSVENGVTQVTDKEGKTYLTHSSNVILISD